MTQLHESLTVKETVLKESEGFRLTVKSWEATSPKGLYSVNFVNESLNEDGEVWQDSTYNFHLTKDELTKLSMILSTL